MNIEGLINLMAFLAWIAVIGAVAFVVFRSQTKPVKGGGTLIGFIAIIALILSTTGAGLVFVEPNELGVVISALDKEGDYSGVRDVGLSSGLNWIVPVLERVEKYPKGTQEYTMSIAPAEGQISGNDSVEARTSDGQIVHIDATVTYFLNPDQIVKIHVLWGHDYVNRLIRVQARGIIRDAVAEYGVEEVVTSHRQDLITAITTALAEKMEAGGLVLDSFVLRNVAFSPEYSAAIEQKQISEQQAQQALLIVEQSKNEAEQARQVAEGVADAKVIAAKADAAAVVIAAEAEAEARLIQAEAEAQALALLGAAIAENPDILTLQYIEKLAENITVMLLPSDNPFLLPLPGAGTGGTAPSAPVIVP